ncbi:MAG: hypothetical protein CVV21_01630 [Candidatus Goldiibacteriota bacterium HGW-Goldbacteria-1]|nr:MAG: hypothetical protein CVV21_01630 [Candidatus Goldiibacteriota bacterium HGW-Goldbacteria-1]
MSKNKKEKNNFSEEKIVFKNGSGRNYSFLLPGLLKGIHIPQVLPADMLKGIGILFSVFLLIAAMFSFSNRLYNYAFWLFIIPVLILLIFFTPKNLANADKQEKLLNFTVTVGSRLFLILKMAIALCLTLLGQYFLFKGNISFSLLSYAGALVQLGFIFEISNYNNDNAVAERFSETKREFAYGIKEYLLWGGVLFSLLGSLFSAISDNAGLTLIYFILTVFFMSFLYVKKDDVKIPVLGGITKVDWLIAAVLFFLALILRLYNILDVPPGFSKDELNAFSLFEQAKKNVPLPMYIESLGAATLGAVFIGKLGTLFGLDMFTVRFFHAAASSFNVVFIFLLGRELFGRRTGVIAGLILALISQHLIFSSKLESMNLTMLAVTVSFFFYFAALRNANKFFMVVSGIFLGFGIYLYTPGRVAPVILVLYWIILFILNLKVKGKKDFLIFSVIMVFAALIVFAPMLDYVMKNTGTYFKRASSFNILPLLFSKDMGSAVVLWVHQFGILFRLFFSEGCANGVHNFPGRAAFDYLTGFFFLGGLGYMIYYWKSRNNLFVLLWFTVGMGIAIISFGADLYPARIILAIPAVALIAAVGLDKLTSVLQGIKIKKYSAALPVIIILLAFIAVLNMNRFFVIYPQDASVRFMYGASAVEIRKLAEKHKNSNVFCSRYFYDTNRIESQLSMHLDYLKMKYSFIDVSDADLSAYYNAEGKDVLIVTEGVYTFSRDYFLRYYPNAKVYYIYDNIDYLFSGIRFLTDAYGWKNPGVVTSFIKERYFVNNAFDHSVPQVKAVVVYIPNSDILALHGFNVDFKGNKGEKINKKLSANMLAPEAAMTSAVISTLIEIPDYAKYDFYVEGCKSYTAVIDGKSASSAEMLYKGLHILKLEISGIQNLGAVIKWRKNGVRWEEIPVKYFIDSTNISGLMASYYADSRKVYQQLEPLMQYSNYFYSPRMGVNLAKGNAGVVYKGRLLVTKQDKYSIIFENTSGGDVYVDGVKISGLDRDGRIKTSEVVLDYGWHDIEIKTYIGHSNSVNRLLWKRNEESVYRHVLSGNLKP